MKNCSGARVRRLVLSTLTAAVLAAALPALASASSIVFIKDHNVWLANPDGSGQYQVTLDGTAAEPYTSPSQADNGTIFAIKGSGQNATFHKMKQNGVLLAAPFESSAPGTGPLEASISPDGSLAAYSFLTTTSDYSCWPYSCVNVDGRVFYTRSDRFTHFEEIEGPHTYGDDPSWVNDGRITFANGSSTLWTDGVGPEEARQWFDDYDTPGTFGYQGQSYRDADVAGQTVALVRVNEGHIGDPPADGTTSIQIYNYTGTTYSGNAGVTATCAVRKANSAPPQEDPTLSPDGALVAWQEPDGIWAASTGCGNHTLIVPGGREPDWGPAAVNPEARPDTEPPGMELAGRLPKLGKALRRGIPLKVECSEACSINSRLLLGRRVVGKGKATLPGPGVGKLTVKFTKAGKRLLKRKRKVKLTLVALVKDAAGNSDTPAWSLPLRR